MDIEDAIVTYILDTTTGISDERLQALISLRALIGRKFYAAGKVPPGTPMPYLVRMEVSNVLIHTLSGQNTFESPKRQISAYAATENESKTIAGYAETALKDFHGTMSGFEIQWIQIINRLTMSETISETVIAEVTDIEYEINYINAA
jgi:hypothetical protein